MEQNVHQSNPPDASLESLTLTLDAALLPKLHREVRTWDNWYCRLATEDIRHLAAAHAHIPGVTELLSHGEPVFLLGYLNAPRVYFDGERGPNQHHFHSRLGTALTRDFSKYVVLTNSAFDANADEGSIWSGSFLRQSGTNNQQLLFLYTARDLKSPYGLSQEIRLAASDDGASFHRLGGVVKPDSRWYDTDTILGDTSIHAFRDPFPFSIGNEHFLLISAKSRFLPKGEIRKRAGENGVIAVYRLRIDENGIKAEATSLCFAAGISEMEVPSIYWDRDRSEHVLFFSAHTPDDYRSRKADEQGLPMGGRDEKGEFFEFAVSDLPQLLQSPLLHPVRVSPHAVKGGCAGSYANRVVPEYNGKILGFDLQSGLPTLGEKERRSLEALS